MTARRVGAVTCALWLAVACGLQPVDDSEAPQARRIPADPHAAQASGIDAGTDAPKAPEAALETGEPDAACDAQPTSVADALDDASDAIDSPDVSAPSEPECSPPSCYYGYVLTWQLVAQTCAPSYAFCPYGCVMGDAGPACAPPPAECALGTPPSTGVACPILAAGKCFSDGDDACACACPGKSCTIKQQSGSKIPKLKLPPAKPHASMSDAASTSTLADAQADADAASDFGDGASAAEDAAASDAANDGAQDAAAEASSGQLIAVCGA